MMRILVRGLLGLLIMGLLCGFGSPAAALEIQQVTIQGNRLLPDSTILAQVDTRAGLPYNPRVLSEDIQKIYALGFFESVKVNGEETPEGLKLTFVLQERPFITAIEFEGNKKMREEKLEEVLTLAPAELDDPFKQKFYPLKIQEDVAHLEQLYHETGYHQAQVTAELVSDPEAPQKNVRLCYTIDEGQKVSVRAVEFEGNTALSDKKLRKVMMTRKKGLFSFFTGTGKYEENAFRDDLERIKLFYMDHGYLEVSIPDYALDFKADKPDLYITITIDEGDLYKVAEVGHRGNTIYSDADLEEVISVAPGDAFSRSEVRDDMLAIADLYAKKGYLTPVSENTEGKLIIDPRVRVDREANLVNLTYSIREGQPHTLNRIAIVGNEITRDKVIRRELNVLEGKLFQSTAMERSRQKIMNLGLFEDVEMQLEDVQAPNEVNLTVKVTERSTGSFNFGGGYSSLDQWVLSGGVSYGNLFGLAHKINFSASLGGTSQRFNLNYTMPHFLDTEYLVGLDAYKISREYSAYDSQSTGGGVRFGRKITDFITGTLKYRYEQVDISEVNDDASAIIKEAEGLSKTSSLSAILKRSTLNNVLLPTKGMVTRLTGELAGGALQGENDFYKVIANHNIYFPLIKDSALRLKGEFAYADSYGDSAKVPIFERFFGGGADTVRGYEERSIGPKDENDESIGGNKRVVLTSEIIVPITKQMRFVTFFDMGDVYGSDEDIDVSTFRKGVGVGVRVFTPFGLIRIDWGYKLERESGESDSEIHFGIGTLF
jgi:outer membrane protein insertion porin family